MITSNIEYIRPNSIEEAYEVYHEIIEEERIPIYYSGGTEITTFMSKGKIKAEALIDIKSIPYLCNIEPRKDTFFIGSAVNLNVIVDKKVNPIISSVLSTIADKTTRNHITLGGNICGRLAFREAILPFMLIPDTKVEILSKQGIQTIPVNDIFNSRLKLNKGDLFLGVSIPNYQLSDEYFSVRKTRSGDIDYPLLHIVVKKNSENEISIACSGYHAFPYNYDNIPFKGKTLEDISDSLVENMTQKIKSDLLGSSDYRKDMMRISICSALKELEVI